jgi:hypothetical protein
VRHFERLSGQKGINDLSSDWEAARRVSAEGTSQTITDTAYLNFSILDATSLSIRERLLSPKAVIQTTWKTIL